MSSKNPAVAGTGVSPSGEVHANLAAPALAQTPMSPAEFEAWRAIGVLREAEREAKKQARENRKKKGSGIREP